MRYHRIVCDSTRFGNRKTNSQHLVSQLGNELLPMDNSIGVCPLPTPKSTDSFWHTEPSPLLLGHRSTRKLPSYADVVVIGSGITGTSVAHHLLQDRGKRDGKAPSVLMLEAREACWGATGRVRLSNNLSLLRCHFHFHHHHQLPVQQPHLSPIPT